MRFRGEDEFRIDAKGRMSIPASYRRVLEDQDPDFSAGDKTVRMWMVYADRYNGYLECFSVDSMTEIELMLDDLPQAAPSTRVMRRWYQTQSQEFVIDDTGRIVLPAKLRARIGVEQGGGALFVGVGKTFQIWNPDAYAAHVAAEEAAMLAEEQGAFDPEAIFDQLRREKKAEAQALAAAGGAGG